MPCGGNSVYPPGRLLISATLEAIDGPGGVLGSAGPRYSWSACPVSRVAFRADAFGNRHPLEWQCRSATSYRSRNVANDRRGYVNMLTVHLPRLEHPVHLKRFTPSFKPRCNAVYTNLCRSLHSSYDSSLRRMRGMENKASTLLTLL